MIAKCRFSPVLIWGLEAGFTLLELLVVMTIMATLLAVVPRVFAGVPSLRFRAAVHALADELRQAQDDAIRTGQDVEFTIDPEHATITRLAPRGDLLGIVVDGLAWQPLDARSAAGRTRLRFFADGTASGGTLILSRGTRRAGIFIDWITGRVRIEE